MSVEDIGLALPIEAEPEEVRASDRQTTLLDLAALLAMALIVVLFHVLVPELRDNSPLGASLRLESLRRVVTGILGFLVVVIFIGEADNGQAQNNVVRWLAGGVLALYVLYVASYTFLGQELATRSALPMVAEWAALLAIVVLWQPWTRSKLYRKTARKIAPSVLVFAGAVILGEAIIKVFDIKQFLLPAPSVIASTFATVYPRTVSQGWLTFQNALAGFAIGCGAGMLFGLVSARFINFSRALLPYAVAANSIPIIAFAPITNAWFGVTSPTSKIAVVVLLCFFPVMINTVRGLTTASPASVELMRSLAASEFEIFTKLRFPTALPYIFNALKVATTLSMIGAIVAEYFGGPTTGLGVQISSNATLLRYPLVWSQIIIASVIGITFYFSVSLIERLLMPWHISFRGESDS